MDIIKELYVVYNSIDRQIKKIKAEAERQNIDVYEMQNMDGSFVLAPLLIAQADILLVLLNLVEKQ